MPLTIRKANPELVRVLLDLRRAARTHQAPIWRAVAAELARPRHQLDPVNVAHLERLTEAKETVVIPGKLLATGQLTKPVTVAAWGYSSEARSKIRAVGGSALTIPELLQTRPDGKGVRLLA